MCLDWSSAVSVPEWHVFVPLRCLWLVCVCLDHPWVIRFLVFLLTWAVSCVSLLSAVLSFPSAVLPKTLAACQSIRPCTCVPMCSRICEFIWDLWRTSGLPRSVLQTSFFFKSKIHLYRTIDYNSASSLGCRLIQSICSFEEHHWFRFENPNFITNKLHLIKSKL